MFVPIISEGEIVDEQGKPTVSFLNIFIQLLQNMQEALSNEGFEIPMVSSAVIPPATLSALQVIQNSFVSMATPFNPANSTGTPAGTLVFDPAEINGGSSGTPNGQLKVLLGDGTFHKVTNS